MGGEAGVDRRRWRQEGTGAARVAAGARERPRVYERCGTANVYSGLEAGDKIMTAAHGRSLVRPLSPGLFALVH